MSKAVPGVVIAALNSAGLLPTSKKSPKGTHLSHVDTCAFVPPPHYLQAPGYRGWLSANRHTAHPPDQCAW